MENMAMVKNEVENYSASAAPAMTTSEGGLASKVVRRRRREPALLAPISGGANGSGIGKSSSPSVAVKRSSRFRGVSRHRWTGRFEAHLWDKNSWNPTQRKKGKQVYLGAYDEEEAAARAYDLAALKYWGPTTYTNFPVVDYENELKITQDLTKEEYLASLRRRSNGFSRGVSKYRGVARHHQNGRWEARIGRVFGNKYLYLGTYSTQEEAARAYDIARGHQLRPEIIHHMAEAKHYFQLPFNPEDLAMQAAPAEQLLQTESQSTLPRGSSPFLLDHAAPPGSSQEVSVVSPGGTRKRGSSTALSLLLKSSVFRQLVENSDAEDQAGGEAGAARAGEAYEYHDFLQADGPDICGLFSSGCGDARNAFQGGVACYDCGEGAANWNNGLGNISSLP